MRRVSSSSLRLAVGASVLVFSLTPSPSRDNAASVVPATPAAGVHAKPALWGELEPGSYAVGFRVLYRLDRSRVWRSKRDLEGRIQNHEWTRPVRISLWYPAASGSDDPQMPYGDYVLPQAPEPSFQLMNQMLEERDVSAYTQGTFNGSTKLFNRFLRLPTIAVREAPAAPGKFPLVLYSGGYNNVSHDNAVLCEYLASHGYVVANVPHLGTLSESVNLGINPVDLETHARDLEFAMGVAYEVTNADPQKLALMGFSMGGVVSLWLQARNPNVDAVVGLDPSFGSRDFVSLTTSSPYFQPRKLRVPLLTLRRGHPKYQQGSDDSVVEQLPFADRYLGTVAEITHGDFSSYAMVARLLPTNIQDRTPEQASRGYMAICRIVLTFFDAMVKANPKAGERLRAQVATAAGPIQWTLREGAHILTEGEFAAIVERDGLQRALALYRAAKTRYPDLAIIDETSLTRIGYRLLAEKKHRAATEVFQLVLEAYPDSTNAYDSLADACLAQGHKEKAAEAYEALLRVFPSDSRTAADLKERLKRNAEEKLRELRGTLVP